MSSVVPRTPPADPRSGTGSLLSRVLRYGVARGAADGLLASRGLLLAILLPPSAFGGWALFRLAGRYAALAELGVPRGLEYGVAQAAERASGERLSRTALGYTLLVFGGLAISALIVSFLVADPDARFALRILSVAVVAERLWVYGATYLRSSGGLAAYTRVEFSNALLHFALTPGLAYVWGFRGALAGFLLAAVIRLVPLARQAPIRPALNGPDLRRLLGVGIPMALAAASSTMLVSVDRLVVAAAGGTTLLGQYALAGAIAGLAATLPTVVRTVVFPDLYRSAARDGVRPAITELMTGSVIPFATIYPPLLGLAALWIGPVVSLLFPAYADAIDPARLYIFMGVAAGYSALGSVGLVAAGQQGLLPALSAAGFLITIGLSIAALSAGLGLAGVAAGALLVRTCHGAAILTINLRVAGHPGHLSQVMRVLAPMAYCVALTTLLSLGTAGESWAGTGLASLGYVIALLPLVPFMARELRTLRRPGVEPVPRDS